MISTCTFSSARWARDLEIASWPATRNGKFFQISLPFLCWFVCWLLAISGSNQWRGAPMESKLPAAVVTKPSIFGTRDLEIASRRWPGTRICKFFQFFLSGSVDSCDDFSQFQGPFSGVEPRWKGNCQRQLGQHHQDLGLAIWGFPVDAASTGNLQTASPKSWWFRRHCRWRFVFQRDSTPQKGPWNCKKSRHESTEKERETLREQELGKKIGKKKQTDLSARSDRALELECFVSQYVQEN